MSTGSIAEQIQREVSSWPGVSVKGNHPNMVFFHVGDREIGHLHGDRLADLPFPVRIRKRLVAEGRADPHYLHPGSGWITYYIHEEGDIERIVELLRLNYSRPWLNPRSSLREVK